MIHNDLKMETVAERIKNRAAQYQNKLTEHTNEIIQALKHHPIEKRLKKKCIS